MDAVSAIELPLQAVAEIDAQPSPEDERFWSVTTILKAIGSDDALIGWSANQTAECAVEHRDVWIPMIDAQGQAETKKWIAGARFRPKPGRRTASALGNAVHEAIEQWTVTGGRPDVDNEVAPFLNSFEHFLDRYQPTYEAAELTVYRPEYRYAGTLDGILNINVGGRTLRLVIDYKTSADSFDARGKRKGPYASVALQLAAYRYAEFAAVWRARRFEQWSRRYYLLNDAESAMGVPLPEVDGGLVIHITPLHCDIYPVACGPDEFTSFLYAIEAARWDFQLSKKAIGEPIDLIDTGKK